MADSKDDKKFNDTLKRLMDQKPKPQEEVKRDRKMPQKITHEVPADSTPLQGESDGRRVRADRKR